jgi:hypothetical protein
VAQRLLREPLRETAFQRPLRPRIPIAVQRHPGKSSCSWGNHAPARNKNSCPSSAAAMENSLALAIPTCPAWTRWKAGSPKSCHRKRPPLKTARSPRPC